MSSEKPNVTQALSFGAAADVYERSRPPYPAAAIDWLLPSDARRVLDLGAGTGKLTRLLCARGLDVIAVEPSSGMREQLTRTAPAARVLDGTAEHIPLGEGTVDAVLVAQAWHWVDPRQAVPEVARVLRPGGALGMLWNIRDEREDWVAELGRLMHRHGQNGNAVPDPAVGPPLRSLEHLDIEWRYQLAPGVVVDLVASRSYVLTLPQARRAALLDDVRTLLGTHPSVAGHDLVALPYITHCFRTRRG